MNPQSNRTPNHRVSASFAALVLATALLPPLPIADARSIPPTLIKSCNAEQLFLPSHPDIEALQQLYERYLGYIPLTSELGMTRLDLAAALTQLVAKMNALKTSEGSTQVRPQDWTQLQRLQRTYAKDIAALSKREEATAGETAQFGRQRVNAPAVGIAPLPAPPAPPPPPGTTRRQKSSLSRWYASTDCPRSNSKICRHQGLRTARSNSSTGHLQHRRL